MPLTAVPDWKPSNKDQWIEFQIANLITEFNNETDRDRRNELWARISELHEQRSIEYVAYLEQKKGLFRG